MTKPLSEMETLFKALADATRLRILGLLLTGEVCVCHIHESLKISQPKASRHLAYLRRAGLVETRRDGLWINYRMARLPDPVLAAIGDAVRHALTHMDAVHRDAERLRRKTGCCVPSPGDVAGPPCCGEEVGSARGPREDSESSGAAARASGGGAPRAIGK
jgi:ArsR family transcriptional regulator